MYSVLAWREPSKAPRIERQQIGPVAVQWVWIHRSKHTPQWLLRRRVDKAAQYLVSHGITQGVFPSDMAPTGIFPVSNVPLRQHLAVALLWAHLSAQTHSPAQATVGLVGGTMNPPFLKTLEQLALHHRHVLLHATDAASICQQLRSRYGVAIQYGAKVSQLNDCDGIIAFTPLPGLRPHIITYDPDGPLPALDWPQDWPLPHQVSSLQGWAIIAGSTIWQEPWTKLAIFNREL